MHTIVWRELLVVLGRCSALHVRYEVLTVARVQHVTTCAVCYTYGFPTLLPSTLQSLTEFMPYRPGIIDLSDA